MSKQRVFPELLSKEEEKELFKLAEDVWHRLEENKLGGYSDFNRPFYILWKFKTVIEKFGKRDIGETWTRDELDAHPDNPK